eukprot:PLAT9916.1.p1 GENE.PLAT9916.1~~PLAT9916.1.p1  ORF type:complete len:705 (+),score=376.39 PLAT9916.1:52-2166(+)
MDVRLLTPTPPPPASALKELSEREPYGAAGVPTALSRVVVESYDGERDEGGCMHGRGKAELMGGHTYVGQWWKNMMHGEGKYEWADGTTYDGSFEHNAVTGRGKLVWPNGNVYEGDVRNGRRHGVGTFWCAASEATYEGEWQDGLRHGKGILFFNAAKTCFYDGDWAVGVRSGFGVMVYSSGNRYEGDWVDGKKQGKGVMRWFSSGERYEGDWLAGLQHGYGEHVWLEGSASAGADEHGAGGEAGVAAAAGSGGTAAAAGSGSGGDDATGSSAPGGLKQMCNQYLGQWRAGRRHGQGTFLYANGSTYVGGWLDDRKEGMGVFTFEDGSVYHGAFRNDRMVDRSRKVSPAVSGDGAQVQLFIDDIVEDEDDCERALLDVRRVVLRYNSMLKAVYKYYSALGTGGVDSMFTMSMSEFWRFARDCAIPDYQLTLAAIDRIFLNMRRGHQRALAAEKKKATAGKTSEGAGDADAGEEASKEASAEAKAEEKAAAAPPASSRLARKVLQTEFDSDKLDLHDSSRPILLRQFVEVLVRLSHAKYMEEEDTLAARVARLLAAVKERAMKADDSDHFRITWLQPEVRGRVAELRSELRPVFAAYSRADRSLEAAGHDTTMNVREFMILLRDTGVIGETLSLRSAMQVFRGSNEEDQYGYDDVDSEMIFEEFLEGLARIAAHRSPDSALADSFVVMVNTVILPAAKSAPTLPM